MGDLLNASPPTLVLMEEGLVAFATKTKTLGKSDCSKWGSMSYAFSTVNKDRIQKVYELFKN